MKKDITPKEYIQNVEEELYTFLEKNNYKKLPFPLYVEDEKQNEKKLKRYYKIIISILYKQLYCNNEYDEEYNGIIRYIIEEIEKNINDKNLTQAYLLLASHINYILDEMKQYFTRTKQNYILRKMPLQKMIEQKQILRIQQINTFMMQDCFEYYCNPLTHEEQIIGEILEINNSLKSNININATEYTLLKIITKYREKNLNDVIMFIICNAYQNAKSKNDSKILNLIAPGIENSNLNNDDIVNYFLRKSTNQLLKILEYFIKSNESIKEGYLKSLERESSYEYVEKRLKKPE